MPITISPADRDTHVISGGEIGSAARLAALSRIAAKAEPVNPDGGGSGEAEGLPGGSVAAGVRKKTADPEWMASTVLHSSLCHSLGLKKSQLKRPQERERESGSGELL